MKRVVCNWSLCHLMCEKWGTRQIGLFYCAEKNNKIYVSFGDSIEIYDKSEYVNMYGGEMVENEHTDNQYQKGYEDGIKEFANRLKEEADFVGIDTEGDFLYSCFDEFRLHDTVAEAVDFLSKLVLKEMVGDTQCPTTN